MTATLQRESTEYVYIGVTGDIPSVGAEVAFLDAGTRPTTEWSTAIIVDDDQHVLWDDAIASGATGNYFLARLIGSFGSGGVELTQGTYQAWVRLTDTDEQPVLIAPEAVDIQ